MRSGIGARLSRLEAETGVGRDGPAWWSIQKWLGHALTADQEAAVAAWREEHGPDDLHAVDMTGWSPAAVRQWEGR